MYLPATRPGTFKVALPFSMFTVWVDLPTISIVTVPVALLFTFTVITAVWPALILFTTTLIPGSIGLTVKLALTLANVNNSSPG